MGSPLPVTVIGHERWSTQDVEPQRAFAYWSDTVFQSLLDIESPVRAHFRAQMERRDLGPVSLFRTCSDMQTVRRTRSRISRQAIPGFVLLYMCAGEIGLKQGDRAARLGPGDATLIDMSLPYDLECLIENRSIMLHFQKEWLENWIPAPAAASARLLRTGPGWTSALIASLASLDATYDEPLVLPPGVVADQLAALLALSVGVSAQARSTNDKLLDRIRRTIQERCHESTLGPAGVAQIQGISKRYLHHVCASASTTFGAELMRIRLDQAHRLLSDRRYDSLAVSEVSARCGFVDPSHFARRFRQAFGTGPSRFRTART